MKTNDSEKDEAMPKIKAKKFLARPYTYLNDSIGLDSVKMLVLLSLQVIFLVFTRSYTALAVIFASVSASVIANLIDIFFFENLQIEDHFQIVISVVQGLVTGLLIPGNYPPITVFFMTLFAMLVFKNMFGGYAHSWVNVSCIIVVMLWIVGSSAFPEFRITKELLSMRNPSQIMIENGFFPLHSFDRQITEALNNTVFSIFKVSVPEGYVSLLWDNGSVIPAFRFNILTLVSSIVLFSDDSVKLAVPFSFVASYMLLVRFLSPLFFPNEEIFGDVVLALFTGGTLFCSVFILDWYAMSPATMCGKIIYGAASGIFAFFISGFGENPVGIVFTVLVSNIFSVFVQKFEVRFDRKRMEKLMIKKKAENGII